MLAVRWILSFLFNVQMYLAMFILAVVFAPWALFSREGAFAACHSYCRWVIFTARIMLGLKVEVRGTPPTDEVVVAAKHQSFFDILVIFNAIPRGKFIMKRELIYAPFLGQYAMRIGCVFVDRGKRGAAIAKMKADVARSAADPGQLVIYPQGTRVAPGMIKPYKVGSGLLYEQLGQPCVPVATNIGVFWPKRGILRKPGTCVVDFLPRIEPGLPVGEFMKRLEHDIETTSNALLVEAGFTKARP
ncbi:MAG: lysophospholipid acyltransferase family protein [Pseudotabrizicola sp.]|uniref:lysophospholipid acyltransferase family protein n=1 Tax=Pseudotabrizicola sp. TaxID=2939647 RepID=UPI002731EFAA|nr:lysophospholipid acyltransferase family protein [Pseudotabrizicola sp.]MDP2082063.1 lysophospholipid acyltransferase family protein [Pseudotabrizicola sp.]MDZ7576456.1 lysophospholipid acyltransferase family protein [Pseudotabrizicola sp.]